MIVNPPQDVQGQSVAFQQIVNGGFETSPPTAPPWVLTGIQAVAQYPHAGTYSLMVYSGYGTQTIKNIPVNSMVSFSIWAVMKSGNDPNCYVRITYSDATYTDVSLSGVGTNYVQKNILSVLTAGKIVVQIKLQGGTTQPCWVDDASLSAPSPISRLLLIYPPQS
jgi:hypothetical protein